MTILSPEDLEKRYPGAVEHVRDLRNILRCPVSIMGCQLPNGNIRLTIRIECGQGNGQRLGEKLIEKGLVAPVIDERE